MQGQRTRSAKFCVFQRASHILKGLYFSISVSFSVSLSHTLSLSVSPPPTPPLFSLLCLLPFCRAGLLELRFPTRPQGSLDAASLAYQASSRFLRKGKARVPRRAGWGRVCAKGDPILLELGSFAAPSQSPALAGAEFEASGSSDPA